MLPKGVVPSVVQRWGLFKGGTAERGLNWQLEVKGSKGACREEEMACSSADED